MGAGIHPGLPIVNAGDELNSHSSTFPAISSILSPDALAKDILPGFGINTVSECKFYAGGFNHTYRVVTPDGCTYYLRIYRLLWRTLEDILCELDVLCHLAEKGSPAACPIPYEDGHLYHAVLAPEGRRFLALFRGAPGAEITYQQEPVKIAQCYGRAVASMHNALDDFNSTHARFHLDLNHFIDQPLHYIQPFLSHRPADWDYLQKLADKLRQRITAIPAEILEQGYCHGDLQGYHANLAPDGTLTFFDFDCSGVGYRAYDLAVFLWCCRLEDAIAVRWNPFLNSYRETRQISDQDVEAIPYFVCARYLWHMGVHAQNAADWGIDFLNNAYFERHLSEIKHAEEEYLG